VTAPIVAPNNEAQQVEHRKAALVADHYFTVDHARVTLSSYFGW